MCIFYRFPRSRFWDYNRLLFFYVVNKSFMCILHLDTCIFGTKYTKIRERNEQDWGERQVRFVCIPNAYELYTQYTIYIYIYIYIYKSFMCILRLNTCIFATRYIKNMREVSENWVKDK